MANREKNSGDSPNLDFTLKAMQQQFERLNMVLGDIRDRMDRQDEKLANLQNDRSDDGNSSRRNRRNHGGSENFRSESFSLEFFIWTCNLSRANHPCGVYLTLRSLLRFLFRKTRVLSRSS